MNALLGDYDLASVIKLEGNTKVPEASLTLSKATGINFSPWPAINVSDFDKITKGV